jgi:hypothetical protein
MIWTLIRICSAVFLSIAGMQQAYSTEASVLKEGNGLPNLSDRPPIQDKNIDVFVDFLYWYTSETIDWAFDIPISPNPATTTYKTIAFDWAPGFRVGLGYNMFHDQWDTQASYTWFQSKATDHTSGRVESAFFAARISLLEPFQTGKVRLDLHYNMFDWDLGRRFLVSSCLSLRPLIGIKAGWIDQTIRTKWTIGDIPFIGLFTAKEVLKNNFRGGGPKGGVHGKWILGNVNRHQFSLIGNFEAAYMWGHWTIRDEFFDIFNTHTFAKVDDRNFGAFVLGGIMGLGWDFNFDKTRSHFALKICYEIQDWFNQVQLFTNTSGGQNNDLILQGLTVDLRFDF